MTSPILYVSFGPAVRFNGTPRENCEMFGTSFSEALLRLAEMLQDSSLDIRFSLS
jgi:hypothetical protein